MSTFYENASRKMSQNTFDDTSTSIQVIAWCRQATQFTRANIDPSLCYPMMSLGHNELFCIWSLVGRRTGSESKWVSLVSRKQSAIANDMYSFH